jgi:hypothetical protein
MDDTVREGRHDFFGLRNDDGKRVDSLMNCFRKNKRFSLFGAGFGIRAAYEEVSAQGATPHLYP